MAANEDVVNAAMADAVGPAVTTEAYGELPDEALEAQDLNTLSRLALLRLMQKHDSPASCPRQPIPRRTPATARDCP